MEQFALASVYPRSIAWLIRPDEWERFEEIVKYNCAMVGGYFNVFIPCTSCSYRSCYPAEHVGPTFECTRCFQTQIYRSNPLWLYKLPEVIFQGFEDNMQVPLLALHHLKCKSQHSFEWVPDTDVYWVENSNEIHKNVDLLSLCDGKLYIGEAKSSDEIEANQFSFYEDICRRVAIDGVVFATSKSQWKRATLQRIEQLKTQFSGEVLVLTGQDLYPVTPLS